jgi:hypothetical protein
LFDGIDGKRPVQFQSQWYAKRALKAGWIKGRAFWADLIVEGAK